MAQCLHLERDARRCGREAVPESVFCLRHNPDLGEDFWLGWELRRWLLRVVALALLGALLFPLLLTAAQLVRLWLN